MDLRTRIDAVGIKHFEKVEKLKARCEDLQTELEALKEYARHKSTCAAFAYERVMLPGSCTCGLDKLLKGKE